MTNAELIEKLRILQNKNSLSLYKREVCRDAADALEAAEKRIKELESQAAFFDAEKLNYQENIEYRDERIKDLENALAACRARKGEQMPKEGEWIKHGCEEDQFSYCECPFCGFIGLEYQYCPNCGAKMKGESDE